MKIMQRILGEYVGVNTGEYVTLDGKVEAYVTDQMQGNTTLTHTALGTPYHPELVPSSYLVSTALGRDRFWDAIRAAYASGTLSEAEHLVLLAIVGEKWQFCSMRRTNESHERWKGQRRFLWKELKKATKAKEKVARRASVNGRG